MLSEFHCHTEFSGDCDTPITELIETAIAKKIDYLCITDHLDYDFPGKTIFTLDLDDYVSTLRTMKERYADQIQLLLGIEFGLQPHLSAKLKAIADNYGFDYIIGSSHVAKGEDVFDPAYFAKRGQYQSYLDYYQEMLENVTHCSDYCCYGHLDYVARYGDFDQKYVRYEDYHDLLDQILRTIIDSGKGIEINTSGYRFDPNNPHPNQEILRRYHQLGGEIIVFGSDSHVASTLTAHFDQAKDLAKAIGFRYQAIYINQNPQFYRL